MSPTPVDSASDLSRVVALTGVAWGAALAACGPAIWRAVQRTAPGDGDRVAIWILAARHLGQGSLQALLPTHLRGLWLTVDALHATTMAVVAIGDPGRRRAALVTGGAAALSATGTAVSLALSRSEQQ